MPLYGHELSESIDPLSAGLQWAVDLSKNSSAAAPSAKSPGTARSESWSGSNWKAAASPARERQ